MCHYENSDSISNLTIFLWIEFFSWFSAKNEMEHEMEWEKCKKRSNRFDTVDINYNNISIWNLFIYLIRLDFLSKIYHDFEIGSIFFVLSQTQTHTHASACSPSPSCSRQNDTKSISIWYASANDTFWDFWQKDHDKNHEYLRGNLNGNRFLDFDRSRRSFLWLVVRFMLSMLSDKQ